MSAVAPMYMELPLQSLAGRFRAGIPAVKDYTVVPLNAEFLFTKVLFRQKRNRNEQKVNYQSNLTKLL